MSTGKLVEREIDGKWYLAKILSIYQEEKKLTIQYLDGNMQIEDDVDFFEIRSHGEGGLEWKYFASDQAVIFLDDLIERKLDDTWYEAMILEVHFSPRLLKIQHLNGNIEKEVPFEDIRQMETLHIESPKESHERKFKPYSSRNPISLNTFLKIQSTLEAPQLYELTHSLDTEDSFTSSQQPIEVRRRTKSEDNILMALVDPVDSSFPVKHHTYPPKPSQRVFPPQYTYPLIRRNRSKNFILDPLLFLPLAGYCEKCCRLTIYRCKQCGLSFFCSRSCQIAEWRASHSNLCIKTPFHPLFTPKNVPSGAVSTDASIPNVADTGQVDWRSANTMPVRYCASYPTLKVHTEVDHGDWLNPEADSSDMETHPPSYEEAIKEQTDAFVDVELMTPSVGIPMTDFKSNKRNVLAMDDEMKDYKTDVGETLSTDDQTAKSLSEALSRPIEEIRKVLRSMNGDAEKALEWFLGQSSDATESSPVDEENSGLPEYGKRARNLHTFVPEDESVPSDANTINEVDDEEKCNAEISSLTSGSRAISNQQEVISRDQYRMTHPNRTCFLIRENLLTSRQPTEFPACIFSGSISLNGRICHSTLTCQGSDSFTLDLVPLDSIVGFVTLDDDPPTKDEVINDEIFVFEHHPLLRISKIRPFTQDGSVEAVMDSLVKGKHIQTPYALDSKYSTEPHQIVISKADVLKLLQIPLFEYEKRFQSSLTSFGPELFEKITLGLQTFVVNPFAKTEFQKYVVLGYHLRAMNSRSGSLPTLLCQSIKGERVPIYFEVHSKGSQVRERPPLTEGWDDDPPDFVSGSNLSTGNTQAYTVVPFNQSNPKSFSAEDVLQLMEMMAIDNDTATRALKENSGDLSEAVEWIIQGMPSRYPY